MKSRVQPQYKRWVFFIQNLLKGFWQNLKKLTPVIVAQFNETFPRPLMDIWKNSNTRGDRKKKLYL